MKKKLTLLGIALLSGSTVFITSLSVPDVYAQESSINDSTSPTSLVSQLKVTINQATPYLDNTKYREDAVAILRATIKLAQDAIDGNYAFEILIPKQITAINNAVQLVKEYPLESN